MKTNLSTLLIKWIGMLSLQAQAQRDLFHGVGVNTGCATELQERIPNLGVGGLHPDSGPGKVAFIQMGSKYLPAVENFFRYKCM